MVDGNVCFSRRESLTSTAEKRRQVAIRVVGVGGRRNVLIPLIFFRFEPLADSDA